MMRDIARVVVHHSATDVGTLESIRHYHMTDPSRLYSDIGYHFLITNGRATSDAPYVAAEDGTVHEGRPLAQKGSHAAGNNWDSIGICLVGDGKFTRWQYVALIWLLIDLNRGYHIGLDNVLGHCEVDPVNKPLCPGFDMELLRAALSCANPAGNGSNPA